MGCLDAIGWRALKYTLYLRERGISPLCGGRLYLISVWRKLASTPTSVGSCGAPLFYPEKYSTRQHFCDQYNGYFQVVSVLDNPTYISVSLSLMIRTELMRLTGHIISNSQFSHHVLTSRLLEDKDAVSPNVIANIPFLP